MHPVPVVEQGRKMTSPIRQDSMKSSVDVLRELGIIFVGMHEIPGAIRRKLVLPLFKSIAKLRVWKVLTRKDQRDIASLDPSRKK